MRREGEKTRVACIGDSITYGYGIRDREQTYPAVLQELLGEEFEVGNFGNSGRGILRKSMKLNEQRGFIFMPQHRVALAMNPQIVLCNLGINDLMDWDRYGDEFVEDYRLLLADYKALETKPRIIIWHRLAPLFPGRPLFGDERVDVLNERIAEVAQLEEVETIDLESPLRDRAEWFPDKLHPNEEATGEIARVTAEYLVRSSA